MKSAFIRAEIERYGGRVEFVTVTGTSETSWSSETPWFRIDIDRTNTRVEVMADGDRYHIKATGQMGTIVDVLGMLAAGE